MDTSFVQIGSSVLSADNNINAYLIPRKPITFLWHSPSQKNKCKQKKSWLKYFKNLFFKYEKKN